VNNSDVSLGYQFCKNITYILCIIYNVRYNNIQLMPALKVNIIIVHPRGVVFPEGFTEGFSPRENNIPRVNNYDVHFKCRH
jgi:hypothetical protein